MTNARPISPYLLLPLLAVLVCALLAISPLSAGAAPRATLQGSKAVAPKQAPRAVKQMIKAANHIRHRPYKWGGGHKDWKSHGYDCSGSVSYVLHRGGYLDYPLDSTGFMKWGKKGPNRWVKIFASKEHVFMVIAGLRWDTSYITDGDRSGPGWSEMKRPTRGFKLRHPAGINN